MAQPTYHQLKMTNSQQATPMIPKDRSPKVPAVVRTRSTRSPRVPPPEVQKKKRLSRVSELESQLAQLHKDLNKAKNQLGLSETWKIDAQQEAQEAKMQLIDMNAKLEVSERQLLELSASEEARLQELCKLSQERDRAWESELESVKKQNAVESAAMVSAINHEIERQLKAQLEMVLYDQSELSQINLHAQAAVAELESLKQEHVQTLSLVESIRVELCDYKESECRAVSELEQSKAQVISVEQDLVRARSKIKLLQEERDSLKLEVANRGETRAARSSSGSYEIVEEKKEAVLKTKLMDKETELNQISSQQNGNNLYIPTVSSDMELLMEDNVDAIGMVVELRQQLQAAQATNTRLEVELNRLTKQADQWRKAAEAAANILSNDKIAEDHTHLSFQQGIHMDDDDDDDDDSVKKIRNSNMMLKKIGNLWKKAPK